jgi:hypothetical protein
MATISIEVTDTELKCMEYCAVSPQEWADNAVTNRARIAGDEIISIVVAHCNENSIALAVGRDAQIQQAFDLGVVQTAEQRNVESESSNKD